MCACRPRSTKRLSSGSKEGRGAGGLVLVEGVVGAEEREECCRDRVDKVNESAEGADVLCSGDVETGV